MAQQHVRNLDWLIDQLKFKLNMNEGQTNQDFIGPSSDTDKWYKSLINEAGDSEVEDAKQNGYTDYFRKYEEFTWSSGDVTTALPAKLIGRTIIQFRDVTDDTIGDKLNWTATEPGSGVFYRDNRTLQWSTSGPSEDKTIRCYYEAEFTPMEKPVDEPDLIPSRFRWILVYRALTIALAVADESVPKSIMNEYEKIRLRWLKFVAQSIAGRDRPAVIVNRDVDYDIY